jgi:outer membrane protein assembly factor BamB
MGREIKGSAAVGPDGSVYVGTIDGVVCALNSDGTEKWRFDAKASVAGDIAIDDAGSIFVAARNLYALNPEGTLRWKIPSKNGAVSSVALGSDGVIYVSIDADLCAVTSDGVIKWKVPVLGRSPLLGPVVGADGTIYVDGYKRASTISRVDAFTPEGILKYRVEVRGILTSSPAVDHDGTLYIVGSPSSTLYALSPEGQLKWTFKKGILPDTPVIGADHTIYIGCLDGFFYAINPDGTLKWTYRGPGPILRSPVIDTDGVISFASGGKFCRLHPNGVLKAETEIAPKWRAAAAPVIASNGVIYVGGMDGFFYAIRGLVGPAASGWPMKRHDEKGTARQRELAR